MVQLVSSLSTVQVVPPFLPPCRQRIGYRCYKNLLLCITIDWFCLEQCSVKVLAVPTVCQPFNTLTQNLFSLSLPCSKLLKPYLRIRKKSGKIFLFLWKSHDTYSQIKAMICYLRQIFIYANVTLCSTTTNLFPAEQYILCRRCTLWFPREFHR